MTPIYDYRPDWLQCRCASTNAGRALGIVFMIGLALVCAWLGD